MDVESFCQVVASSEGLRSSRFSPLLIPGGSFTDSLNSRLGELGVTASVVSDDLLVAWGTLSRSRHFFHMGHISTVLYTIGLNKNTITILLNNCKWRLFICR